MRAQTSVEFLVILAVSVTILAIVLAVAYEQFTTLQITKGNADARNSVDVLKAAATEVYAQGEGSRKQVFVRLPPEYQGADSYVANRTISMKVRGNDVASTTDFDVYGSLPGTSGGHFVWVISEGNRVRIGSIFLLVSKSALSVSMLQTQTKTDTFTITNIGNSTINVTLSPSWTHADVNFSLDQTNLTLDPDESANVTGTFTASAFAVGDYSGSIEVIGDDGVDQESVAVLAFAEVLVPDILANISNVSGIGVIGHVWAQSAPRNQTITRTFSICTQQNVSVTTVTFTGTGTAGAWLVPTSAGPIPADSCIQKPLSLAIPANASLGNNTGTIELSGDGIYNDTIVLIINVLPIDTQPPVITNISASPRPYFIHNFLTINVSVTDAGTGNSNIAYCLIKAGANGTLQNMSPVDGAFDSPTEQAYMSYPPYFLSAGNRTFFAQCADAGGNLGNFSNITVMVHKEFLLVFKANSPTTDEALWYWFISIPKSELGYAWSYDITFADDLNSGNFSSAPYAVLLYADYVNSVGNDDTINAFNDSGRATVLLGQALKEGPRELGLINNQGASQSPETNDFIVNILHYITSPYLVGTITYYNSPQVRFGLQDNVAGTHLMQDTALPNSRRIIVDAPKIIMFGPTTPSEFNQNGTRLAVRALDYAINISIGSITD